MKINILTLNWNGEDNLKKLYPTLIKCLEDINYTWAIKDNSSKDSSIELIKSWKNQNIHLIEYPHNKDGFSAGNNLLFHDISPSDDDYVLLLNNDIEFTDNKAIKQMIKMMENDNRIGIVGARLMYNSTNILQHAGVVFHSNGLPMNFRNNIQCSKRDMKDREFQAVTGACMLTKAKYYSNICKNNPSGLNGLDEGYYFCFEDIDACLRVRQMDKKVVYCGRVNIFHEESVTLKKNPVNKLFLKKNAKYFLDNFKDKCEIDYELYDKNHDYNSYQAPRI